MLADPNGAADTAPMAREPVAGLCRLSGSGVTAVPARRVC